MTAPVTSMLDQCTVDGSFLSNIDDVGIDVVGVFCIGVGPFLLIGESDGLLCLRLLLLALSVSSTSQSSDVD